MAPRLSQEEYTEALSIISKGVLKGQRATKMAKRVEAVLEMSTALFKGYYVTDAHIHTPVNRVHRLLRMWRELPALSGIASMQGAVAPELHQLVNDQLNRAIFDLELVCLELVMEGQQ